MIKLYQPNDQLFSGTTRPEEQSSEGFWLQICGLPVFVMEGERLFGGG